MIVRLWRGAIFYFLFDCVGAVCYNIYKGFALCFLSFVWAAESIFSI